MPSLHLSDFEGLFGEFASTYLAGPEGQEHVNTYLQLRSAAEANWEAITQAEKDGEDVTQQVLLKLLPWADTASNRQKGAWVHIAPAITGDLVSWFEAAGWTRHEDWPQIARAILAFVRRCTADTSELAVACTEFAAHPYSKGFQSGMLSPILNALRPSAFLLVNSQSRVAINHFAGVATDLQLTDYPAANAAGRELLSAITPRIDHDAREGQRPEDIFDVFTYWLKAIKDYDFGTRGYWKVAPGEAASQWERCREGNFICVGWDELGDLTGLSYADFAERRDALLPEHADWAKEGVEQVWTLAHIQEGDRIVANRGTTEVLGIGTVTGPYFFANDADYRHRLPVRWDDLTAKAVDKGGWRRTLIKLSRRDFEEITQAAPAATGAALPIFTEKTFELLKSLHDNPSNAYYQLHKQEFVDDLELPFKQLFTYVAAKLPTEAKQALETSRRVTSIIPKNDFGKGGAWDFYWGAFYPKDTGRTKAPQLFVWINHAVLEFGFYIGEYGEDYRKRFSRRARENRAPLVTALQEPMLAAGIRFGGRATVDDRLGDQVAKPELSFTEWLDDAKRGEFHAAVVIPRDVVVRSPRDELVRSIADVFDLLYPFVRLASEEAPIGDILGEGKVPELEEPDRQPEYPIQKLAEDTGLGIELLEAWVRAIERKGQAVVYGPPGTGKTYVAQRVARYLAAGGDGFVETVQFHPSYSYEDFIEGIRPQVRPDGTLVYEWVRGRFLDFCLNATSRKDRCVLIIDEINRANLSRVLGELMYLLEYRNTEYAIPLAGGRRFWIPDNVRLLGTMNTADRSIALVDHALRRRFAFLALRPNYEVLRNYHAGRFPVDGLVAVLMELNDVVGNPDYSVGITYFLDEKLNLNIEDIWTMEMEPYLEEYFFDRPQEVAKFRWKEVKARIGL